MNQAQQVMQQYSLASAHFTAGFTVSLLYGQISTGIRGVRVKIPMPHRTIEDKRKQDGSSLARYEYSDGSKIKAARSRDGEFKLNVE